MYVNKKNLNSQNGMTLIGVMMAGAASLFIMAGVSQMMMNSLKQKNSFSSDVDAASLQMDIKKALSDSSLCELFLVNENENFDENSETLNFRLASDELIEEDTDLISYDLKSVRIAVENVVKDSTPGPAGESLFTAQLYLNAKKKSEEDVHIKPRNLGSIFLVTDSSGAPTACSTSSVDSVVECDAGSVKLSTGPQSMPECKTPAELIGGLCPTGKLIMSSSNGVSCRDMPVAAAPVVRAPASTSTVTITNPTPAPAPARPRCTDSYSSTVCNAYTSMLGREFDAAGAAFWQGVIDDPSNGITASNFASEFKEGIRNSRDCNAYRTRNGSHANSYCRGL